MAPQREWTVSLALADGTAHERKCRACLHYEAVGVALVQFWRDNPGVAVSSVQTWTLCKYGHKLTGPNVRVNAQGARICVTCARRASRESHNRNGKGKPGSKPAPGNIFDIIHTFCAN